MTPHDCERNKDFEKLAGHVSRTETSLVALSDATKTLFLKHDTALTAIHDIQTKVSNMSLKIGIIVTVAGAIGGAIWTGIFLLIRSLLS